MIMLKKLLLASSIAALSTASMAMEAMDEDALSATTGQDGLTVTITPPAAGITGTFVLQDRGGFTGFATDGAIVIGVADASSPPAGTHDPFKVVATNGIVLDIDATGDIDTVTAGNQPALRVGVSVGAAGMVINTGDVSVATGAALGANVGPQTADILNSMTITIGSGSLATLTLGNEAVTGGAMLNITTNLATGLDIANFALSDANSGGSINAVSIAIDNPGVASNLNVNIDMQAKATGLEFKVNTLGSASGFDIAMVDVGLGSTVSIGDVEIRGLNLTNSLINVVGHP